jgi:outer membrane protein assembly factor BamB
MRTSRLWLFIMLAAVVDTASANWPAFKGGDARGIGGSPAPLTWDASQPSTLKWKREIPGVGHSSPIVWGGRVYVTTAVPEGEAAYSTTLTDSMASAADTASYTWRVLALDAATGKIEWSRTLHEGKPQSKRHTLNSYASPTPVTDGTHLFVYFGSEGLYCLDLEGQTVWKKSLGKMDAGFALDPTYQWGVASSPLLYEDLIVIQADIDQNPFLNAYSKKTGDLVWSVKRADLQAWSSPAIHRDPAGDTLVTIAPKYARGYDPRTGAERWSYRWDLEIVISTPTSGHGLMFVTSGKGPTQPILAIRPTARGDITLADGKSSSEAIAWSYPRGGPIVTSPLISGDYLYALSDLGVLRCLTARTGEVHYQQRMPATFTSSPVAADGKLYLTSTEGQVFVVAEGPVYKLLATNDLGEPATATPAFDGGTLIVRTLRHLWAIAAPAQSR